MKNLTHYFKSPKEDEKNNTGKPEAPVEEEVQDKAPTKKRKINLSKSKKKKSVTPEDKKISPETSGTTLELQSNPGNSLGKSSGKLNKKRKIEEESNSLRKKVKTTNSSKNSLNRSDQTNLTQEGRLQPSKCEISVNSSQTSISKSEDNAIIDIESSLSCDEPLARPRRKLKINLFEDSDNEEAPANEIQSHSPSTDKVESNENTCSVSSRNSLFSYFNKVDKETALKNQKNSKIEVKAVVHSSPSGTKIGKKSLEKVNFPSTGKSQKQKNKPQLDDSDSIEVICSEEIVDENSSTPVNVPVETDQNQKTSLSPMLLDKPKPSNLASIFLSKNNCLQSKSVANISLTKSSKETPQVEDTKNNHCVKDTKPIQQIKALSVSKKCKKSKIISNKKQAHDYCEENTSVETVPQQEEKKVFSKRRSKNSTTATNGLQSTSSVAAKNLEANSLVIEKPVDEISLPIVESPKVINSMPNQKVVNGKTPEKSSLKLKGTINEEKTPKNKGSTINGYFTLKDNQSTTSVSKHAKSPWVMKVCLNSASKNQTANSDEDDYDRSQDSGMGGSETLTLQEESVKVDDVDLKENEESSPVVIIDDEDNPSEDVESSGNSIRRSLRRNAKKPKENILDSEDVEEEEVKVIQEKRQTPKQTVKMWPFFQKGGARQTKETAPIDEAKLKAKMLFLESGVPESLKRKVESVKSDIAVGNPAPFPTVSHVLQADGAASVGGGDSSTLPLPRVRAVSPPPAVPPWTSVLPLDSAEECEIPVFERPKNVKSILEKLKEEEKNTDVKVLYKKLKEYKNKAESDIWTEVYKPISSADMVGNSENIKKLKTWLETLKNCRKREGSVSSGDEFVNDESDEENNSFNNMAMICGPCGCGKTSAVYAIAKELDIKVLEINASCNRSGKRILAEFSESTQSHHVERSQPLNGFFNNQSSGKKKRKKLKNLDISKSEKTSLILVEDADLLFADCDEGFVAALASLAASSKRPIILVSNQENTPHLDRFNNSKLLRVTFNRPRHNKLSLWLRLVGLVEGVTMSSDLALRLVTLRNCDVRRCLLELQLMIHSNNSEVKDKQSPSRLWWGWPGGNQLTFELPTLHGPEEEKVESEVDKKLVLRQLQSVADTTKRLALLDLLSPGSREEWLEDYEDPCPQAWTARRRDSTALTPPSGAHLDLGLEAAWLQEKLAVGHQHRTGLTPQEAKWLTILRQGEQLFMPGITTTAHTSHQSVACDYLPTLRDLGRAEQVRLANYTRRANRFFNYLQGLGIHASKSYRDFMCDAFS